jgi:ATP-dependent DNA ligase
MIVATPDGRADFELLTTRLNRRPGDPTPGSPVSLYVFDVLRHHGHDLRNRPWSQRRAILDDLELAERTEGAARPTVVSPDGNAMHQATADIGAEGTVSAKPSDPSTEGAGAHAFGSKPNTPEPTPSPWSAGGPPPRRAPAG